MSYLRWKKVGMNPYPTHVHGGHTGQRYAVDPADGAVQAKVDEDDAAEMLSTGAYATIDDESTIGRILAAASQMARTALHVLNPVNIDQMLLGAMKNKAQALRYVELLLVPLIQAAREGDKELREQLAALVRPVELRWNLELPAAPVDEEGLELAPAEKVTAEGARTLELPAENPEDPYGDLATESTVGGADKAQQLAKAFELQTRYKKNRPALVKAATEAGVSLPMGNETIPQIIGLMTGLGPEWARQS